MQWHDPGKYITINNSKMAVSNPDISIKYGDYIIVHYIFAFMLASDEIPTTTAMFCGDAI